MKAPPKRFGFFHIFFLYLRLGCVCFGGPVAHLAYFREEFVLRRKWLTEQRFADLLALCQFVPGPSSSQLGFAIGWERLHWRGAAAAWLGFTLPSAAIMILCAYGLRRASAPIDPLLDGLLIAAAAVVAKATIGLGKRLSNSPGRIAITLFAASLVLNVPGGFVQLLAIGLAAVMGQWLHPSRGAAEGVTPDKTAPSARSQLGSARLATVCLTIFAIGLILSLATLALQPGGGNLYAYHYKAGALVFGGGHVVLPLLNDGVAATRLVSEAEFLAGYGMAQALPGPLFTLSAYLGTVAGITSPSFIGGLLALVALFAPGLLLIIGLLPYWDILQQKEAGRRALAGVNAAVVGLLVAAFIDPVWVEAIRAPSHFAIAGSALLLLYWSKVPTAVVVLLCAIAGYGLSLTGYTSSL